MSELISASEALSRITTELEILRNLANTLAGQAELYDPATQEYRSAAAARMSDICARKEQEKFRLIERIEQIRNNNN